MSGLVCYMLYYNSQQEPGKKTWAGWSRECWAEWGMYIRVAIPSMVMICLDWWTFEVGGDRRVGGVRMGGGAQGRECWAEWGGVHPRCHSVHGHDLLGLVDV